MLGNVRREYDLTVESMKYQIEITAQDLGGQNGWSMQVYRAPGGKIDQDETLQQAFAERGFSQIDCMVTPGGARSFYAHPPVSTASMERYIRQAARAIGATESRGQGHAK